MSSAGNAISWFKQPAWAWTLNTKKNPALLLHSLAFNSPEKQSHPQKQHQHCNLTWARFPSRSKSTHETVFITSCRPEECSVKMFKWQSHAGSPAVRWFAVTQVADTLVSLLMSSARAVLAPSRAVDICTFLVYSRRTAEKVRGHPQHNWLPSASPRHTPVFN